MPLPVIPRESDPATRFLFRRGLPRLGKSGSGKPGSRALEKVHSDPFLTANAGADLHWWRSPPPRGQEWTSGIAFGTCIDRGLHPCMQVSTSGGGGWLRPWKQVDTSINKVPTFINTGAHLRQSRSTPEFTEVPASTRAGGHLSKAGSPPKSTSSRPMGDLAEYPCGSGLSRDSPQPD